MMSGSEAVIATLKLEIEKLKRALYGQKSERRARLLDQLELRLEELEAAATEDELAAEQAAAQANTTVRARAPPPGAQAVSGTPAARAGGDRGAGRLRLLRLGAHRQDGRGRHRDARGDPPAMEGDPDRPGEVHLPGLREDHPAACAVPPDAARLGRPEPAGDDPVREVRPAPAAEPGGRALCPRGRRSQPPRPDRSPWKPMSWRRSGCTATTPRCRCSPRAGPPPAGSSFGPTSATTAPRRRCAACRAVPLLKRPQGRASRTAPRALVRHAAGRRLCRLPRALCRRPKSRPDPRGAVLGARKTQVIRACRHRRKRAQGQGRTADLTHRAGGGAAH
jgi:hypothetical protein